jgi:5-formyltetrahydrofolate cyclo-ligase
MTDTPAPPETADLAKAALRKAALAARAALPNDIRFAAAKAVAAAGAEIVARKRPARVSLFVSIKGEIGAGPLAVRLTEMGVPLCLPVIVRKGEPLVFREWRPGDPLEDRPFGLKEPPASVPEVEPDLLFTPLAAFDAAGRRLGYGGGFYDRTLAKLRAKRPTLAIGLAFSAQEVENVPVFDYDQPIDGILTEKGYRPVTGQSF